MSDVLRVPQLNLWGNDSPYEARVALLRRELLLLAPDLPAFEEAGYGPTFDQAATLLEGLDYHPLQLAIAPMAGASPISFWARRSPTLVPPASGTAASS